MQHIMGAFSNGKLSPHEKYERFLAEREEEAIDAGTLRKLPVDRELLRERNIALTKRQISASVTPDRHVVHAIGTIEEIDRVANRLAKKLRDWYKLYDPELEHAYKDHRAFVAATLEYPKRSEHTMGGEFSEEDLNAVMSLAQHLSSLYAQRDLTLEHLERLMQAVAPNVAAVAGPTIGANLIAIAGSLQKLSRMPAGTIQLLGAEAALFKHLRNKRIKPPKHGIIFNHILLQRSKKRGRTARVLADCIAIASRVDYFKGEFVGNTLLKKVEASVA